MYNPYTPGNMNWSDYRILLVDDEKDILEFLSYNLRNEGFEIHTARNGQEAVSLAGEIKPQLVLMDVMMPEMDGIEACEEIRANKELENTLVAFLTARGEDYSQIAGFEAGGDDYITKPIKPKVLVSRIKAMLKRRSVKIEDEETGSQTEERDQQHEEHNRKLFEQIHEVGESHADDRKAHKVDRCVCGDRQGRDGGRGAAPEQNRTKQRRRVVSGVHRRAL